MCPTHCEIFKRYAFDAWFGAIIGNKSLIHFQVNIDRQATASELLGGAFSRFKVGIAPALRVRTSNMFEQRLESVNHLPEFGDGKVFPLVEMH